MSELLARLQAQYPHYKMLSEPDPACNCKGTGERAVPPSKHSPEGRNIPCLCVCLAGDNRAETVRLVGEAAKRLRNE